MRSAKVPIQDIFNFNVCSQCLLPFPPSVTRDVRHAVPCGHVFCKDCLGKVEAEQKSGKSVCRRAGCERELAPVSEFAISWVPQRLDRIKVKRQHMFPPQGNVGDRPLPTCSECGPDPDTGKSHLATHQCKDCGDAVYCCAELASVHPKMKATKGHVMVALAGPGASPPEAAAAAAAAAEPVWNICAQHNLPFRAVEAATHRPVCSECMFAARGMLPVETFDEAVAALETPEAAATSAEVARQKAKLAEPTFTAYELRVKTAKWCADETARIRAWEEREVKHVHTVADDTVQLVEEVCLRKLEVGASLITQRTGLRATLEEFEHALADLPSDPAARLSKKRAVHMERKQLCDLLVGSKIAVPSTHEVLRWAGYPDLSAEFDQKSADDGGSLAKTISAAAKATLGWTLKRDVLVGATVTEKKAPSTSGPNPQKGVLHVFPVIPKLVSAVLLRCSSTPHVPCSCPL